VVTGRRETLPQRYAGNRPHTPVVTGVTVVTAHEHTITHANSFTLIWLQRLQGLQPASYADLSRNVAVTERLFALPATARITTAIVDQALAELAAGDVAP
jgi:hypothetical protein